MGAELLVDDAEGAFDIEIGLLDADVEGVFRDDAAVGEGHHAAVHEDAATQHPQFVPVGEDGLHGVFLHFERVPVKRIFMFFFIVPESGYPAAFAEKLKNFFVKILIAFVIFVILFLLS